MAVLILRDWVMQQLAQDTHAFAGKVQLFSCGAAQIAPIDSDINTDD
jgi:hypothetical protein